MPIENLFVDGTFQDGGALERLRYFDHQLLNAADMRSEQEYFRRKLMRHNRFLHGWGVVCGFDVQPAPTDERPWQVRVEPGYALGPFGHEIQVLSPALLDLALCGPGAITDPCDPRLLRTPADLEGGEVFIAIRYAECVSRPRRVLTDGCGCQSDACEFSRVRSSFELICLPELPPSHETPPGPSLCEILNGEALPTCPPQPEDPWVVLARVTLPDAQSDEIAEESIETSPRRRVFSTQVLQEQLINCCCRATEGADLEVSKSILNIDANESIRNVQYQIEITNHGPETAEDIVLTDLVTVPSGSGILNVFNFTPPELWTVDSLPTSPVVNAEFEAQIASLAAGETVVLQFAIQARIDQGTLTNTATVTSATPDPVTANNSANITHDFVVLG